MCSLDYLVYVIFAEVLFYLGKKTATSFPAHPESNLRNRDGTVETMPNHPLNPQAEGSMSATIGACRSSSQERPLSTFASFSNGWTQA